MSRSLEDAVTGVYLKFKLQFYQRVFQRLESREASLSTVETFSVEVIDALGTPTISEFARFIGISVANATYKVQNLINKGYLRRERSEEDRRKSYLYVTERFHNYKSLHTNYIGTVAQRVEKTFSAEDVDTFRRILETISDELMPEIKLS